MDLREQHLYQLLGQPVHVEVDRPIGYQHGDTVYPVNYGYIPGLPAGDGEEQDAYILGVSEPVASFDGWVVGAIRRKNDREDKLVVAPEGMLFHQGQIAQAVHFQEQYFDTYVLSLLRKSCGVIPHRQTERGREYLIVYQQHSQCWSLPKGHMEAGETQEQTALRELWEETGLTAQLDTSAAAVIEYTLSPVGRKQVVLFPGKVSGTPRTQPGEIERFRWVTGKDLAQYLHPDTMQAIQGCLAALDRQAPMIYTGHYDSPLGGITLASDGQSLTGLWFDGQKHFPQGLFSASREPELPVFRQTSAWLDCYFSGSAPDFTPPLSVHSTPFRERVWEILLTIPYGQTMTYGQIAALLAREQGKKMSAQAVGGAVGHNPISLIIPCHRVVGRDGSLTGYAGGLDIKAQLLGMESMLTFRQEK